MGMAEAILTHTHTHMHVHTHTHTHIHAHSKIRIVIMTTVVCYGVGDDEHIMYSTFVGGVGQEFRKHIRGNCCGRSWSKYVSIKANRRELVKGVSENTQSNCSNCFLHS